MSINLKYKLKQRARRAYKRKIRSERWQTNMAKMSWAITKKDPKAFDAAIKRHLERNKKNK